MGSEAAVLPRLRTAREKLDARDLAGALAIYEEVLAVAGDRGDVLMTISGDLGSTGNAAPIIELIAPRYDPERHGPAAGLNLVQAYLAVFNPEGAQHVLDLLFTLKRPELEERLYGFSRAITEVIAQNSVRGSFGRTLNDLQQRGVDVERAEKTGVVAPPAPKIALATISKPIWFYGLEASAADILPPKEGRLRRLAFAPLALVEVENPDALKEGDELARLSRALPLWLAEVFYFSPLYTSIAAVGQREMPDGTRRPMVFNAEWSTDNLRQLMDSSQGGLDYVFTGTLRQQSGDYEVVLRVWEMKKFRERKLFRARWAPATADASLAALRSEVGQFMEWAPCPDGAGLPYAEPASPRAWLDALEASLGLFLAGKGVLPKEILAAPAAALAALAPLAASTPAASLAWLTLLSRALALGLPAEVEFPPLSADPRVEAARAALGL